jgi:SAM-dependent methyltransferase
VSALPDRCVCCDGTDFLYDRVLPPELVSAWDLAPAEAEYIDYQQGYRCTACGSSLRAMALARAIVRALHGAEPFSAFIRSSAALSLRVLEINNAATLTPFFEQLPGHTIVRYPDVDMTALPYAAGSFDLVCHSDTLEHVADPVAGLRECRRVLAAGGVLAYTVPLVVGRLTRRRDGLPPSYHLGAEDEDTNPESVRVWTEYGADAWLQLLDAGFDECRIVALAPPRAHAFVGIARG